MRIENNFDHVMHVGFDPDTGEFTGMPDDWARLLKSSKIDVNEIKQAPDTVIAVSSVSIPCQWYTVDVPLSLHFRPEKIVNLRGICKLKGSITLHIEDRI